MKEKTEYCYSTRSSWFKNDFNLNGSWSVPPVGNYPNDAPTSACSQSQLAPSFINQLFSKLLVLEKKLNLEFKLPNKRENVYGNAEYVRIDDSYCICNFETKSYQKGLSQILACSLKIYIQFVSVIDSLGLIDRSSLTRFPGHICQLC